MAIKTIPQLQEATSADENTLIPIDSGIQSYKITLPNLAKGIEKFTSSVSRWDSDRTYDEGDIVNFGGSLFKSLEDNNTDTPGSSVKWLPEYLFEEIDLNTSPQKGAFSTGILAFCRVGRMVTVTGIVEVTASPGTVISSASDLIPAWARPIGGPGSIIMRASSQMVNYWSGGNDGGLSSFDSNDGIFSVFSPDNTPGLDSFYLINTSYVSMI